MPGIPGSLVGHGTDCHGVFLKLPSVVEMAITKMSGSHSIFR